MGLPNSHLVLELSEASLNSIRQQPKKHIYTNLQQVLVINLDIYQLMKHDDQNATNIWKS